MPTKVLVLTTFDLDEYVFEALRAGASGFLLKDAPAEELAAAIRVVAAGESLLAPGVTRRVIDAFVRRPAPPTRAPEPRLASLTPRELEVLGLLARGLSNLDIATRLFVSEGTTKTHVSNVLTKLGLRDRVQAVIFAYENAVVRPGRPARRSVVRLRQESVSRQIRLRRLPGRLVLTNTTTRGARNDRHHHHLRGPRRGPPHHPGSRAPPPAARASSSPRPSSPVSSPSSRPSPTPPPASAARR